MWAKKKAQLIFFLFFFEIFAWIFNNNNNNNNKSNLWICFFFRCLVIQQKKQTINLFSSVKLYFGKPLWCEPTATTKGKSLMMTIKWFFINFLIFLLPDSYSAGSKPVINMLELFFIQMNKKQKTFCFFVTEEEFCMASINFSNKQNNSKIKKSFLKSMIIGKKLNFIFTEIFSLLYLL